MGWDNPGCFFILKESIGTVMESFGVFSGMGIKQIMFSTAPNPLSRGASGLIFLTYYTTFCLIFFFFERDIYRLRLDNQFSRLGLFPSISESPKKQLT